MCRCLRRGQGLRLGRLPRLLLQAARLGLGHGRRVLAVHSEDELRLQVLQKSRCDRVLDESLLVTELGAHVMPNHRGDLVRPVVNEVVVLDPHVVRQGLRQLRGADDVHEHRHPGAQQLLRVVHHLAVRHARRAVAPERRDLHAQRARLVALGAQDPRVERVLHLQEDALQEDLGHADQPLHLDRVPERIAVVVQVQSLRTLLFESLQQLAQQEHPVLQDLGRPLVQPHVVLVHASRHPHGAALGVAEVAMHLRLHTVGPLQLLCNEVCFLHQGHDEHQLLLEPLHRDLVVPVVLLLGRGLLGGRLELLDPLLGGRLGGPLPVLELPLEPLDFLGVLALLLGNLLLVGRGRPRLLLQPLPLAPLQLLPELLLPPLQQLVGLVFGLGLRVLRLLDLPLQLLRQLAARLQVLLRGAAHLAL
mmetsp:Transcript_52910/g.160800  ORF Transcript_52910/g.160800 Transcript_52910/m.160800 type:complete len:419 (-) Transcript_52910:1782-3038(-)